MAEELAQFQLTVVPTRTKLGYYVTPNAHPDTLDSDLTVIRTVHLILTIKDFSAENRNMAEEEDIPGSLEIPSTIMVCLADATKQTRQQDARCQD